MADARSSNSSPASKPLGRTTPVLVPQGVLEGQPEIPLNRPVTTVGSNETARLHLLSRTVSKGHALFVNSGGATYVADLASRTGVLVNGKLARDAELKNGDRVQIGKFVFRYRLPANLAAAIQPIEAPPAAVIVVGWPALPVTGRVVSIGRGERSDISLTTDSAVSAPHAVIFQVDGKWYIRDMNSRTGTQINGKAIHQNPLNFGDRIVIGSSTILFQPGAAIEEESFDSQIEPQEQEISEPVEVPLAAIETKIPVADEPIPLFEDETLKTGDWKTAFPAAVESPIESSDPIPLDFAEVEPKPVASDWAVTPATDLPIAVEDAPLELADPEPILSEAPVPIVEESAKEIAQAETDLSFDDALLDLVEPEVITDEKPTPVIDAPATWIGSVAAAEAPMEGVEVEPVAAIVHEPAAERVEPDEIFAEEPTSIIDDSVDWNTSTATDLLPDNASRELVASEPVIAEESTSVVDEPLALESPTAAESPADEVPHQFVEAEPIQLDETTPVERMVVEHPLDGVDSDPMIAEETTPIADQSVTWAPTTADELAAHDDEPSELSESEPIAVEDSTLAPNGSATWGAEITADLPAETAPLDGVESEPAIAEAAEAPANEPVTWDATAAVDLQDIIEPEVVAAEGVISATSTVEDLHEIDSSESVIADAVLPTGTPLEIESAAIQSQPAPVLPVEEITEHESVAADDKPLEQTSPPMDAPLLDEVDWAAAPVTDLPVEEPAVVEPSSPDFTPEPVGEISWGATPQADLPVDPIALNPQTPVEEFVFDPAVEPVSPEVIPGELFFGDPEPQAVVSPAVEAPKIDALAINTDSAFDAAVGESFAEHATDPIVLPDVTEELSMPEGLAAFAKASFETAEPYIESLSTNLPESESGESISELSDLAKESPEDSAAGWTALSDEEESPAQNIAPHAGPEVVDAEWTDAAEESAAGWSAVVNHDALPAEPELPFAEIEEDSAEGEESIGWSALVEQDETPDGTGITSTAGFASATDEADLDFLDFEDTSPELPPEPPAAVNEVPKAEADPRGPAHGPSIFGFQFEGGSFLGGMPISLHQPTAEAPAIPPTVFDANRESPSGIDAMTPPVTARSNRPMTPPRPDRPAAPVAPLAGLISDVQSPWSTAPVIPPTARTQAKAPNRPKRGLTTAFSGPGLAARTTEVFSQLAAPIGVEVFGGKPGNPNQFIVPDSKETAAEAAAEEAALAAATHEPVAELASKKRRRSRLPWLSVLFVGIPAGLWALTYLCPPVSSKLVSAKLLGSLQFDGLSGLSPEEVHAFHKGQEARLYSEDVRETAETILENKHQPAGFTANDDDFSKTVDSQSLNWSGNMLQFTFNTSDPSAGSDQVNAVLAALAQKDRDLDDAKARARAEANSARAAADELAANLQRVKEQRVVLLGQAVDRPDGAILNAGDQDAAELTQKYNDARAIRQGSESVLADLRSQDPSKPIDIEADPKIVELKKRLDPLNEQIARLKGISAVGAKSSVGTDVPVGATTQPDTDVDPLLAPLQQQADLLNQKLDQRRGELAADASMSPAQREVNMASRIENLSVKITALQKVETEAKAAADSAVATAKQNHERTSAANLAGVKAEELYAQLAELTADHDRAVKAQSEKETALANCVTVASSPLGPPTQLPTTDLRPPLLALGSGLSCVVFGLMIAGELRRPKLMTSVKPAAAPLVHPPVKVIPWPQPQELSGLESNGDGVETPPVMGEPDQVFGGV